ncbi:hypothetical protein Mycch_2826 [Mycolicibacterium chubuense NBB4]|uniref:Uncharacterized protein n=1 Tax=Mycolicibacterium chubuense (strain NBB4) TaxID=710421 RepID=I4BJY0_MYCCN|nr:hypothetical protein [Mycolicibacterium chubuense]AFM17587.1 hypothetical protein Mycch_2826 [Mycolicibacterium chubuense NBB4]
MPISADDLVHLRRCVDLAREALEDGDHTRHPEFELTRWLRQWKAPQTPVAPLPVATVAPGIACDGPAPELTVEMKTLYERVFRA